MLDNREMITLHFGQAGIQMGNSIWETMITEHGILCNGKKDLDNDLSKNFENAVHTLFHQAPSGQYIPRALIVDTEPIVVDEIRRGYYRNLFHPDLLQSGIEDASNNFARGYYSLGKRMLDILLDKVRYMIESCNNFKGFMSYTGTGGGTGSGLYSLFIERIMLEYCAKTCIGFLILPGKKLSDSIVEPYNTALRISQSVDPTNLNVLIDNESLYKICSEKLQIYKPTYYNINRLLSPIFSSITAPFRFKGPMVGDISDIGTNLVPYPKMNFPSLSYSPFLSALSCDHTSLTSESMTIDVFRYDHSLLNLDIKKHKIMSSYLVYRGNHYKNDITKTLDLMKKDNAFHWVDWCPTGFKVAQSFFPPVQSFPTQYDKSVLMLCNNSGITNHLEQITFKFQRLFSKKCFVHWYVSEGMELDELKHAHKVVSELKKSYEEVCEIKRTSKQKSVADSYNLLSKTDSLAEKKSVTICEDSKVQENIIKKTSSIQQEIVEKVPKKSSSVEQDIVEKLLKKTSSEEPKIFEKKTSSEIPKSDENILKKSSSEGAEIIPPDDKMDQIQVPENDPKNNSDIDGDTKDLENGDKQRENSITDPTTLGPAPKLSNEFILSTKAREVLLQNLTSFSPELKERMLVLTNAD